MKNVVWYFAYGSTMHTPILAGRGVKIISKEPGYLENYRINFNKKAIDGTAKATIVAAEGERIYGLLYKVSAQELDKLNNIEGASSGHYVRQSLPVCSTNGEIFMAEVYVATPKHIDAEGVLKPSSRYIQTLITAALENKLDAHYIDYLKSIDTAD